MTLATHILWSIHLNASEVVSLRVVAVWPIIVIEVVAEVIVVGVVINMIMTTNGEKFTMLSSRYLRRLVKWTNDIALKKQSISCSFKDFVG